MAEGFAREEPVEPQAQSIEKSGRDVENSLHPVKDRSWDEDVHTLRRPGLGEVYASLVNTALNALRSVGWFPLRMSMPPRAGTCAFRPTQTIARLRGHPP